LSRKRMGGRETPFPSLFYLQPVLKGWLPSAENGEAEVSPVVGNGAENP
jgi:hypothetical protein